MSDYINTLEQHGLDWDVNLYPAFYQNAEGEFIPVKNRSFTVREDIKVPYEAVSNDYTVINNTEGFDFLKNLVEDDGLEIKNTLEFGLGREIVIVTQVPEHVTIGEEEYYTNMIWTNRHDGRGSGQGFGTNVCIICKNTLERAKGTARYKHTIRHTKNASLRLEDAREAIKLNFKKVERYQQIADELLGKKLTKDSYNGFMRNIVDLDNIKKDKNPRAHRNALETRAKLHNMMLNLPYLENYRDREWALIQTVTDHESNVRAYRKDTTRFQKLTNGAPLTNRAFELLGV